MKSVLLSIMFLLGAKAFAGGAVVAGGKTNAGILVYESEISWEYRKLIYSEIEKQFELGMLAQYESVTDPQGKVAVCAHFKLLKTYNDATKALKDIATEAGKPEAVKSVGGCIFDGNVN
jgi:hypothetical protein